MHIELYQKKRHVYQDQASPGKIFKVSATGKHSKIPLAAKLLILSIVKLQDLNDRQDNILKSPLAEPYKIFG